MSKQVMLTIDKSSKSLRKQAAKTWSFSLSSAINSLTACCERSRSLLTSCSSCSCSRDACGSVQFSSV